MSRFRPPDVIDRDAHSAGVAVTSASAALSRSSGPTPKRTTVSAALRKAQHTTHIPTEIGQSRSASLARPTSQPSPPVPEQNTSKQTRGTRRTQSAQPTKSPVAAAPPAASASTVTTILECTKAVAPERVVHGPGLDNHDTTASASSNRHSSRGKLGARVTMSSQIQTSFGRSSLPSKVLPSRKPVVPPVFESPTSAPPPVAPAADAGAPPTRSSSVGMAEAPSTAKVDATASETSSHSSHEKFQTLTASGRSSGPPQLPAARKPPLAISTTGASAPDAAAPPTPSSAKSTLSSGVDGASSSTSDPLPTIASAVVMSGKLPASISPQNEVNPYGAVTPRSEQKDLWNADLFVEPSKYGWRFSLTLLFESVDFSAKFDSEMSPTDISGAFAEVSCLRENDVFQVIGAELARARFAEITSVELQQALTFFLWHYEFIRGKCLPEKFFDLVDRSSASTVEHLKPAQVPGPWPFGSNNFWRAWDFFSAFACQDPPNPLEYETIFQRVARGTASHLFSEIGVDNAIALFNQEVEYHVHRLMFLLLITNCNESDIKPEVCPKQKSNQASRSRSTTTTRSRAPTAPSTGRSVSSSRSTSPPPSKKKRRSSSVRSSTSVASASSDAGTDRHDTYSMANDGSDGGESEDDLDFDPEDEGDAAVDSGTYQSLADAASGIPELRENVDRLTGVYTELCKMPFMQDRADCDKDEIDSLRDMFMSAKKASEDSARAEQEDRENAVKVHGVRSGPALEQLHLVVAHTSVPLLQRQIALQRQIESSGQPLLRPLPPSSVQESTQALAYAQANANRKVIDDMKAIAKRSSGDTYAKCMRNFGQALKQERQQMRASGAYRPIDEARRLQLMRTSFSPYIATKCHANTDQREYQTTLHQFVVRALFDGMYDPSPEEVETMCSTVYDTFIRKGVVENFFVALDPAQRLSRSPVEVLGLDVKMEYGVRYPGPHFHISVLVRHCEPVFVVRTPIIAMMDLLLRSRLQNHQLAMPIKRWTVWDGIRSVTDPTQVLAKYMAKQQGSVSKVSDTVVEEIAAAGGAGEASSGAGGLSSLAHERLQLVELVPAPVQPPKTGAKHTKRGRVEADSNGDKLQAYGTCPITLFQRSSHVVNSLQQMKEMNTNSSHHVEYSYWARLAKRTLFRFSNIDPSWHPAMFVAIQARMSKSVKCQWLFVTCGKWLTAIQSHLLPLVPRDRNLFPYHELPNLNLVKPRVPQTHLKKDGRPWEARDFRAEFWDEGPQFIKCDSEDEEEEEGGRGDQEEEQEQQEEGMNGGDGQRESSHSRARYRFGQRVWDPKNPLVGTWLETSATEDGDDEDEVEVNVSASAPAPRGRSSTDPPTDIESTWVIAEDDKDGITQGNKLLRACIKQRMKPGKKVGGQGLTVYALIATRNRNHTHSMLELVSEDGHIVKSPTTPRSIITEIATLSLASYYAVQRQLDDTIRDPKTKGDPNVIKMADFLKKQAKHTDLASDHAAAVSSERKKSKEEAGPLRKRKSTDQGEQELAPASPKRPKKAASSVVGGASKSKR